MPERTLQSDLLKIAHQYGVSMSLQVLYKHGKKFGFLIKTGERCNHKSSWQLDKDKYIEWLSSQQKIPDNFISMKDACAKHNISYGALQYQLTIAGIQPVKMGCTRGGMFYVDKDQAAAAASSYKRRK